MSSSEDNGKRGANKPLPFREIGNANLFADDIVFSDTEKILFEEDLHKQPNDGRKGLMDGNPKERYSPTKKLNEGGMKAIWEVDDHRTARKVAMALIQESKIASEEDIDSFLYEARLTANLQHPNIIPIYDIALDENGNPYFTMKALKGQTLGEIIKGLRDGKEEFSARFSRTRLLAVFLKVCNAIDYAHTKGVIHLDLKPSNVIVGDFGDVHVLDWGLSTLITHLSEYDGAEISWHSIDDVSLENGQTLTRYLESSAKRRKIVGGTPGYMSPEQAQGSPSDIDFQTDVYMLGAMLYEILTYHCPIKGETVKEVLQKTVRGDFPPPGKRAPKQKIPPALSAIALKAMATDPEERYLNVAALIRDIHQYQDGFATIAENPTFFTHTALLVKRHKLAVSLIAASLAVIGAILAQSFRSIKASEKTALAAKDLATERLAELKVKNDYIAATAAKVAPDYLALMAQQEKEYRFIAAEESLDTALAFDPDLAEGWLLKIKMLLCRQKFAAAWNILSGNHGHPAPKNEIVKLLARKYRDKSELTDTEIAGFVQDLKSADMEEEIPRFFYHLNKTPFDPQTRFPALEQTLKMLNPENSELNFKWTPFGENWLIDIGNNPGLDNIAPLAGLPIAVLNASNTRAPDLNLITEPELRELRLRNTQLTHLFDIDHFQNLEVLDLGNTQIRNISNIVKYPKLKSLDLSGNQNLTLSQQLIWNRNLKMLTVPDTFRNDSVVKTLAQRGVIIIYSDN